MQLYTSQLADRVEARRADLIRSGRLARKGGDRTAQGPGRFPGRAARHLGEVLIALGERLAGPDVLPRAAR